MKQIPLSRNLFALVDDEDFEWLNQWKWKAHWEPAMGAYYANRQVYLGGGRDNPKYRAIIMHREIMGLAFGDRRVVDHKDPNATLDNRRSNLRIATHAQNICNGRLRCDNSTGFKGVHRLPSGRYQARVMAEGKRISLGVRATAEEAHELWKAGAKEHYGEFARIS